MDSDIGPPRNFFVSTAGVVLGTLGLLLSIFTAFLSTDTVIALTRRLTYQDDSEKPPSRTRMLGVREQAMSSARRHLRRVASDSSLTIVPQGILVPTISITLHKTGNSISSNRHYISVTGPTPPSSPTAPSTNTTVTIHQQTILPQPPQTAPPVTQPRGFPPLSSLPSQPLSPRSQLLALPPIRTKGVKKPRLTRATSSPQLTTLAAAGVTFAAEPPRNHDNEKKRRSHGSRRAQCVPLSDTDTDTGTGTDRESKKASRKDKIRNLRLRKSKLDVREDAWESVYVNDDGSPNIMTSSPNAQPTTGTASHAPPLASAASASAVLTPTDGGLESPHPQAQPPQTQSEPLHKRPTLRKAKTLGDLLRRVPNSPGPSLPNTEKLESTTKQAFARCKAAMTSPQKELKDPKFSKLSSRISALKHPKSTSDLQRNPAPVPVGPTTGVKEQTPGKPTRKRTQPYEAPYFCIPPDQVVPANPSRKSEEQSRRRVSVDVPGRASTSRLEG